MRPRRDGLNAGLLSQTLFRYLDKQPLADTLSELQAQVDAFDHLVRTISTSGTVSVNAVTYMVMWTMP
ncbi:hypothetical protein NWF34_02030 [Gordonia sp. GONU]|uniref:hypothetical protein n=1 Tax=Gordonia sp. GONU TaxID=2972949 RepID=UPI0021AD42C5|nr:hypothetical protein [Gordonia sp. GONU]MCR8895726.1 hypothetical protein [Gordonia sp. GONU]